MGRNGSVCKGTGMAGRILIAGGEPAFRIGLRARLAAACHDVEQVQGASEATEAAQRLRPDVVIAIGTASDPGAVRLGTALRRHAATRRAGIVALVGETGEAETVRIAALRAGADDALSPPLDDLLLLARIRQLLGQPRPAREEATTGMAEDAAPFAPPPRIALIAADIGTAIGWRHALAPLVQAQFDALTPARALQEAAQGEGADVYLIAGDLAQGDDGLRLLSELRARPASRDAGFVIALAPERASMAPIALDLGAGDVLPLALRAGPPAEEAAMRLASQLARHRRQLAQRREEERNRLWAMTDPLTGLSNRRHALPRLDEMAAEAARTGCPLAVMVLDLDRFKAVNDRFGHAAGDAVLAQIARRLAQRMGPRDLLARLGGEEFLIVRPVPSPEAARAEAEALRQLVSATPVALPAGAGALHITASIGLAIAGPRDSAAPEGMRSGTMLMGQADRALLTAKTLGRDRVLVATFPEAA